MMPPCWLIGLMVGCVPPLVTLACVWGWHRYSQRTGAQLQ
jgi:hypothetical protein